MIRILRYTFSILILCILVIYIYLHREVIPFSEMVQKKKTIGGSILILVLTFLACGFGWARILKKMKLKVSVRDAMKVWFLSQLGKYLPGKIWVAAGRLYLLPGEGDRVQVGYSIFLELILVNVTGLLVFIASLVVWDRPVPGIQQNLFAVALMISVCLVALHPRVLENIVNTFMRLMKKGAIQIQLRFGQILNLFLYYIFCWFLYGLSFSILASAFVELDARMLVVFGGIYIFSIVIGFVTLVAPSGLGVREGVLFVFLNIYLDAPVATYLAVVSRIWFTVVELAMVAIFALSQRLGPFGTKKVCTE